VAQPIPDIRHAEIGRARRQRGQALIPQNLF